MELSSHEPSNMSQVMNNCIPHQHQWSDKVKVILVWPLSLSFVMSLYPTDLCDLMFSQHYSQIEGQVGSVHCPHPPQLFMLQLPVC